MNGEARRVAITGLGLVTPLGNDVAATWTALLAGRSGVAPDLSRKFVFTPFAMRISAISVIPARGGTLTILSSCNGPGASIFCLP